MANEIALISGATSGIGAAFARMLAAQGYNLILTGRRAELLNSLAQELQQNHAITAEVLINDLTKAEGIQEVEEKIASLSNLAVLINNAGFGVVGKFAETGIEKNMDMIQVHVAASVRLTRAALPGMIARKKGAVINVSSLAAFLPHSAGSVTYTSTKAFLNAFSETLSAELRGSGVKVQALCPGMTYTDFHDRPGFENFKRSSIPKFAWMTAGQVASISWAALQKDQVVCIPGFVNHVVAAFGNSGLVAALVRRFARRPAG